MKIFGRYRRIETVLSQFVKFHCCSHVFIATYTRYVALVWTSSNSCVDFDTILWCARHRNESRLESETQFDSLLWASSGILNPSFKSHPVCNILYIIYIIVKAILVRIIWIEINSELETVNDIVRQFSSSFFKGLLPRTTYLIINFTSNLISTLLFTLNF